jgi:hypothetical protein
MPVTTTRRRACVLGFALALAGCSERPRRPDVEEADGTTVDVPMLDAPREDAGDAVAADGSDTPTAEGGIDGGLDVAGDGDAGSSADAPGGMDGADDVMPTFDAAVADVPTRSVCDPDARAAGRICASDGECAAMIERCLPTGCGDVRRCQPAGRACVDASDCLAGVQTCTLGRCVAVGADCGDTRACPLGYTCEGTPGSRRCVDRRRFCGTGEQVCPYNAVCFSEPGIEGFCAAIATRCAHDEACLLGTRCRDVDGDGLRECVPDGPCGAGTCAGDAGAQTCEIPPVEFVTVCGPRGICSASRPCPAGYECVDTWGTGITECHPVTDPCRTHADCTAPRSLCYTESDADGGAAGCR